MKVIKVLKTILKFSVSNIVNLILGLLSAVILTRTFSPDIYGLLNIYNATVATGASILYMGLDVSYIRFYNEPPKDDGNKELGTKLLLCCLLVTVISAFIFSVFFYKEFSDNVFGIESRIIVTMVFVSIGAQIILRFLNIKYRMDFNTRQFTIQSIFTQVISKIFIIVAALLSLSINGVVSFSACSIFAFSLIYIFLQRNFFSFRNINRFRNYRRVFFFAVFSSPLSICININTSFTQQIISHLIDVYAVGLYSSVGYFASILGALQGGFATFWSAYMYRNYKNKQNEIRQVNEYLLLAIIVIYAMLILGKDIVYLIIGDNYQESKSFFSLVLSYPIFMIASETTTYGISIMNKNQYSLACFIVSICINLGLAYVLIPFIGLKGAAISTFFSGMFLYISRSIIGQKLYNSISNMRITAVDVFIIILMALFPAFLSEVLSNALIIFLLVIALMINKEKFVLFLNKVLLMIK